MNKALLTILTIFILALSTPVKAQSFEDGSKAYDVGDYSRAFEIWLPLAERGDAGVQTLIGAMYKEGNGVPQDYAEAMRWYRMAAEQGSERSRTAAGYLFFSTGLEKFQRDDGYSCSISIEDFQNAEELGNTDAADYVYFCGLLDLAENGDDWAQYELAYYFFEGRLVTENFQRGLFWAKRSAMQGNKDAAKLVAQDLLRDVVYESDIRLLKELTSSIEKQCAQDPKCAFDKVWSFLDISNDGSLSIAELSKFQRTLVKLAYVEQNEEYVEVEELIGINLLSIIILPTSSTAILFSFDYNNNGTLQKSEVFGETEFAKLVGIDAKSLANGLEFESLGHELLRSLKNMPFVR